LTGLTVLVGCSQSDLIRQPFDDIEPASISRTLSAAECREDLAELAALVERATPRPFLHRSRQEVEATFTRVCSELPASMTRRQFMGVVREACAAYGIGHQYAVFPHEDFNAWIAAGGRSPSFSVAVRDDTLVIRNPGGLALSAGAKLETLNGWSAQRLLAVVRARTSADTAAQRDNAIEGRFADFIWELGMESPYTVVAAADDGTQIRIRDDGRTPGPRVSLFAGSDAKLASPRQAAEPSFSLNWVTPDIARIRWTRMDPREREAWEAFVQQSADELAQRQAHGLVIDLRDNGGGTSSLARPLLGMISDRPVRMAGGKLWRKSPDYDRFLESCIVWWARGLGWRSQVSSEYADMAISEERTIQAPPPGPLPFAGTRFTGSVVVLIGPRTFSSAVMVADAIATYDLATLAGQPTGGVPSSHGEVGFARLARSGLIVSFSSALFIRASGDGSDSSPVLPDVLLSQDQVADDKDPQLQAAVRLIRNREQPPVAP
jgi:hypothetical protein